VQVATDPFGQWVLSEAMALKISGRTGRYSHINGVYEPMQITHNDKPVWVARSVAPRYIFHSGKARWCISKAMDDGARCWAYIGTSSDGSFNKDPSTSPGSWTCCDQDGEWRTDQNIVCQAVPADNDKFVQLRMTLDADMKKMGLIEKSDLKKMWRKLDYNGNGIVSLAEIDKMVVELVAGGIWPAWLNNKPALMRAYKKTILKDGDGDDWVERKEFHALLLNIFWFNKLWGIFESMTGCATNADRRMDFQEFDAGMKQLGLNLTQPEAQAEFNKIDSNHGGQVLFVEFCAYIRKRVNPDAQPEFDADIVSGEKCGKVLRKHGGHRATHTHFVTKKSFKDFDELEKVIKGIMRDKRKLHSLWKRIDFNGNNIVSLAEIDKLAVEAYPLLNHKPALMRAYKKTIKQGDGDDWVEKKEFKPLLANLFYFNKIFWVFDMVDNDKDRRMDFREFQQCLTVCGCPMQEAQARQEFRKVDKNGGGIILFDEFCHYFTASQCPEAMQDLLTD
jgi:Ca2+-binding EF-hand superfamily protein